MKTEHSVKDNSEQHEILLSLMASSEDFDFKCFLLDQIDDFKYGDMAIVFWNRCFEKYAKGEI